MSSSVISDTHRTGSLTMPSPGFSVLFTETTTFVLTNPCRPGRLTDWCIRVHYTRIETQQRRATFLSSLRVYKSIKLAVSWWHDIEPWPWISDLCRNIFIRRERIYVPTFLLLKIQSVDSNRICSNIVNKDGVAVEARLRHQGNRYSTNNDRKY